MIGAELVIRDAGEYRVTPAMMAEMGDADAVAAMVNALFADLVKAYPDFQFNVTDDLVTGDMVIRWRRRRPRA